MSKDLLELREEYAVTSSFIAERLFLVSTSTTLSDAEHDELLELIRTQEIYRDRLLEYARFLSLKEPKR